MPITKDVKDLGSLFGATSPERAVMIASLTSSAAIASEDRDAAWRKVIRKIRGMLALSDDWDGMGANAPSSDLIFYAMKLAEAIRQKDELPAPTRVAATPVGTIGMEWQEPRAYTEAEIVAPFRSEWMHVVDGAPAKHWVENCTYELDDSAYPADTATWATAYEVTEVIQSNLPSVYWGAMPQKLALTA